MEHTPYVSVCTCQDAIPKGKRRLICNNSCNDSPYYNLGTDENPSTWISNCPKDIADFLGEDSKTGYGTFTEKDVFTTGANRDTRKGKGRHDCISAVAKDRLAKTMEEGAEIYGANNWQLGMPFSRVLDSLLRHINQWQMGHEDEDHLSHAAFNLFALMEYELTHPELNDIHVRNDT